MRAYIASYNSKGKQIEDIHQRFCRVPNCFVAVAGSRVVGVVRGMENRLVNLFVDGNYHRQGIATRLVRRFENTCLRAGFRDVVLRSSLYAVPFYKATGYVKTTGVRSFRGLNIQPMKKQLNTGIFTGRPAPGSRKPHRRR